MLLWSCDDTMIQNMLRTKSQMKKVEGVKNSSSNDNDDDSISTLLSSSSSSSSYPPPQLFKPSVMELSTIPPTIQDHPSSTLLFTRTPSMSPSIAQSLPFPTSTSSNPDLSNIKMVWNIVITIVFSMPIILLILLYYLHKRRKIRDVDPLGRSHRQDDLDIYDIESVETQVNDNTSSSTGGSRMINKQARMLSILMNVIHKVRIQYCIEHSGIGSFPFVYMEGGLIYTHIYNMIVCYYFLLESCRCKE